MSNPNPPTWISDDELRARLAQRSPAGDALPEELATFAAEWDAGADAAEWDARAAQSRADYEATQAALKVFGSLPLPGGR